MSRRKPLRERRVLGGGGQRRGDASPAVLRADFDVLQLGRVGQGEIRVTQGLVVVPGDEVEAVALVEPGEAEDRPDAIDLVRGAAA